MGRENIKLLERSFLFCQKLKMGKPDGKMLHTTVRFHVFIRNKNRIIQAIINLFKIRLPRVNYSKIIR